MNDHEINHSDIAELAYKLWQERGRPFGSPDEDWFRAEQELNGKPMADLPISSVVLEATEQ